MEGYRRLCRQEDTIEINLEGICVNVMNWMQSAQDGLEVPSDIDRDALLRKPHMYNLLLSTGHLPHSISYFLASQFFLPCLMEMYGNDGRPGYPCFPSSFPVRGHQTKSLTLLSQVASKRSPALSHSKKPKLSQQLYKFRVLFWLSSTRSCFR